MSDRLFAATRKGLFTIERQARGRWRIARVAFLGDNVSMVLRDPRDGVLHAALDHGHFGVKMHRSRDEGKTWEEEGKPTYPPKPEDAKDDVEPAGRQVIPWNVLKIWSLAPGRPDQPGLLWCGTIPGGLFRSADGGATWELVRTLWDHPMRKEWFGGGAEYPGIHSICVHPTDGRTIALGVSCGGVWVTRDLGETWACKATGMRAAYMPPEKQHDPNIQDPHCVVQCPARPEVMWAQHHNGVFRTTDGAESWHEITTAAPSVFGFAVRVHPRDADTAWFVPAVKDERRIPVDGRVVVSRTRDGGKTFEVLREGLPQEHAYDLTFRHGLDIDATGECLAFGTTTGSLWVTEDQGDSWSVVSEHLPPVYAVRF
jgi:hypothetical protein